MRVQTRPCKVQTDMLKSRRLSRLTWITGETSLCVLIEIDFDGTTMANPVNFIPYNIKLERSIPTDRQTDRQWGHAAGLCWMQGHKCIQNNEHTMASTRAHVGPQSRRHCQRALKRRRWCRGETKLRRMSRRWARWLVCTWTSDLSAGRRLRQGAMRIWGVVSWVTIIAAMAKEDPQVSMHEGRKSQTEARLARRISVRISHRPNFLPTTTKRRKRENHHSQLLIVLNSFPLDRLSSGS